MTLRTVLRSNPVRIGGGATGLGTALASSFFLPHCGSAPQRRAMLRRNRPGDGVEDISSGPIRA
jgi:hypothetical protein